MYTYQQKISMTPYHDFVEEEEAGVDLLQNLVTKHHSTMCIQKFNKGTTIRPAKKYPTMHHFRIPKFCRAFWSKIALWEY